MHSRQPYGYRYINGELVINEDEAVIVRRIFAEFLAGISPEATAERLNAEGVKPRRGAKFRGKTIRKWLENEIYTGRVILQKYYRPKVAESKCHANTGELPRYLVEESHPPIVDQETFDAVQAELARRRHLGLGAAPTVRTIHLTDRMWHLWQALPPPNQETPRVDIQVLVVRNRHQRQRQPLPGTTNPRNPPHTDVLPGARV